MVDGLEEHDGRVHLVLDIPDFIVDGQGCLSLRAFVALLDQLGFIIPGFGIDELASGLQIQTMAVEGYADSDLIPVPVISVGKETESCIALDFHFATLPLIKIISPKYPKNAQSRASLFAKTRNRNHSCKGLRRVLYIVYDSRPLR